MKLRDFQLERYYARHEFTTPLQLSASDCEALTVGELLEIAEVEAGELLGLALGYTETRGAPALREAIARRYPGCTADDVLVCNAPEEAIFLSMHALLAPGDRVVVMTPCYQSLKEIARGIGCDVVEWPLLATATGWRADLERLEHLARDGAALLVTNAPHNPTGFQPTATEHEHLCAIARERFRNWFSDEMYRGLEPEPGLALAPAASTEVHALSLWGTSKSFGLPGLRIGWLVARDRARLARIEALKDYTSICSNAPGELLARVALEAAGSILARNRERIAANAGRMDAFVRRCEGRFVWRRPLAGPVGLVELRDGSAREHAERVRVDGGVLLVPSTLFDLEDRYLRVGLGRASFPAALERWESVLR